MGSGSPDYYTPDAQLADSLDKFDDILDKLDESIDELVNVAAEMVNVNANLATQILKLIDIITNTQNLIYTGWLKCTTANPKVVESGGTAYNFVVKAHKNNSANVRIECTGGPIQIAPGSCFSNVAETVDLYLRAVSGTQYYQLEVS